MENKHYVKKIKKDTTKTSFTLPLGNYNININKNINIKY